MEKMNPSGDQAAFHQWMINLGTIPDEFRKIPFTFFKQILSDP
jgi:hypothetical protein